MNINSTVGWLSDEVGDYVGIRSGLGVTAADVKRLLRRELDTSAEDEWWYSPREWIEGPDEMAVRIRAEDLTAVLRSLIM